MSKLTDTIAAFWARVQQPLFPHIEATMPEPLTESLYDLIVILELLRVEEVWRRVDQQGQVGAPPADRAPLLRAFLAKAVLKIPTTKGLYDRLRVDGALRRLCGWEAPPPPPRQPQSGLTKTGAVVRATRRGKRRHATRGVPSEATFSRAFAAFAAAHVLDLVHAQRVQDYMSRDVWEHGAYDGTAISAVERPASKPPTPTEKPKKRGRRKHGDPPPVPPPTRVQRQRQETDLAALLAELPTACDKGGKKNSRGDTEWWVGYKMHIVTVEGDIPVAALTTSASMHDSGAAIPLMRLAAQRGVRICYDLMDAAYDADAIHAESQALDHVPIIDANSRSAAVQAEQERLAGLDFSRLDVDRALVEVDRRRRFKARTAAERVNARLKDDPGVRLVRLRGHAKVHALLMSGLLVVFAKALLCL
jgi:hypothetical protein